MPQKIILFDGYCNLCSFWAQFIIKHDKKHIFKFIPLQLDQAKELLNDFSIQTELQPDSIVYLENARLYYKSTALLKIIKQLGGFWSILYLCIVLPKFLRNWIYDIIAKYRYSWFGKRNNCYIPKMKNESD